jgi:hypothetical protein
MSATPIQQAKLRLPLPLLIQQLGLGEHTKKNAQCPFHDDKNPSFSVFQIAGAWFWKCHAGCGGGDEINFLEKYKGISLSDATKLYLEMAGCAPSRQTFCRKSNNGDSEPFDWLTCVNALTNERLKRLGNERWYSRAFCSWLRENHLVGLFNRCIALPVHNNGTVVGVHYCLEDGSWRYNERVSKTALLIIGDLASATQVHVFESQWDMFAFMDRADMYRLETVAFIATRGASNTQLVHGLLHEGVSVCAWPQNDAAAEKWLSDLCTHAGTKLAKAVVPAPHKDLNDWTKAGARAEDIYGALFRNELLNQLPKSADLGILFKPIHPFRHVEPHNAEGLSHEDHKYKSMRSVNKSVTHEAECGNGAIKVDNADDEAIAALAALSPLEYERQREQQAAQLGCRASVLDDLVKAKRSGASARGLQGSAVICPEVELWPKAVFGAEVLNEAAATFTCYVALPAGAADALALWSAHTHCFQSFQCSPRLNISSPERGCGKTTLRDIVALFVPRALCLENLTSATTFRLVEKHCPVILADEYDAWLKDNEELRGLLNAGHREGGLVARCEGIDNDVRLFKAYTPAVLCGIGALPGTLHDRSIVVRLTRAKPGELQARFDSRHTHKEKELNRKLARWIADKRQQIAACDPVLPSGAFNRLADNWRPLFAIAEVAGGDWPARCAAAFARLTNWDLETESYRVMLLADIQPMVQEAIENSSDWLASGDIIETLVANPERPWNEVSRGKPINERWLARRLDPIKPGRFRGEVGKQARGYKVADLQDAIERFISPLLQVAKCHST